MKSVLEISGIECYSFHGCLAEETKIGGKFRVDVSFEIDFNKAVNSDDLESTIDYVAVYKIVREQMAIPSRLIEHVCGRIAGKLLELIKGEGTVYVSVTKFNPPVNGRMAEATFRMQLTRDQ